jgi:hypothetical protein
MTTPRHKQPRTSRATTKASEVVDVEVVAYQELLRAGRGGSELAQAAQAALAPHEDMIGRIAYSLARRRWGTSGLYDHLDDVRGEAYRCALEAIATFDDTKGISVAAWVGSSLQRSVPVAISHSARHGAVPTSWERLARIAAEASRSLTQLYGREPTRGELVADLEARAWSWAGGKNAKGMARLKRSGMAAALENVDVILASDRAPMSLDMNVGDGEDTLCDMVAGPESTEALAMNDLGVGAELLSLALGGLSENERESLGEVLSGDSKGDADSRRILKNLAARLAAPHCQYAYLCGGIESAFLPAELTQRAPASRSGSTKRSGAQRLAAARGH